MNGYISMLSVRSAKDFARHGKRNVKFMDCIGLEETIMKVLLGLAVAANAAYMVHNGARAIGIGAYNDAQVKKYEAGMAAAAGATSRAIARAVGASAKDATAIEKTFSDGVSTVAALLQSQGILSQQVSDFGRTKGNDCLAGRQIVRYPKQSS